MQQFTTQLKSVAKLLHSKKTKLTVLSSIYRPAGLRTQTGPLGVSCQAGGCEVCTPSRKAGSQTLPESQRSQADCSPRGNLKDKTVGSQSISAEQIHRRSLFYSTGPTGTIPEVQSGRP